MYVMVKQVSRMDRKEAIEILKRNKPTSDPRRCGIDLCEAVDIAIEVLQEPERKKGCWKRCHKYEFGSDKWGHRCSECGHEISDDDSSIIKNFLLPNFCEHCGADMRAELICLKCNTR